MAHYIIETIAFQVFFLLIYDLFLKGETFFNWNRFYLITTAMLSVALPFIKVESFKKIMPQEYVISLPEVLLGASAANTSAPIALDAVVINNVPSLSYWEIVFYAGVIIASVIFLFKLAKIAVLIIRNSKASFGKLTLVKILNSSAAFSFFRYVFLGELLREDEKQSILKHEVVHVKQMHSLDLLFFELFRILFWFNPLVYMYQNRVTTLHEFIADAEAVKHENKSKYYQNLLAQVFETKKISFINPFFRQSLIKKRIVMLQKSKSKQINLLKYALLIPMVVGMLVYTSTEAQDKGMDATSNYQELTDKELKEKFYNELLGMVENGVSLFEISEEFRPQEDIYVISRAAYYKHHAYLEYMLSTKGKPVRDLTKTLNTSYKEYLEYKKTEEAKLLWESDIKNGTLRLIVNDMDNLTEEENEKKEQKIKLIEKDDYFHALRMDNVAGNRVNVQMYSDSFSANKRDDTKAVLINEPSVNVGFDVVDRVPIYPGCDNLSNAELKKCLTQSITDHVIEHFNTEAADKLNLIGKQRMHVIFKIDEDGSVKDISVKSRYSELAAEVTRVMNTLPKMQPGQHKGRNVTVSYALPIIYDAYSDNEKNKEAELIPLNETKIEVPFAVIEQIPVFPGCENLSREEQKACVSNGIAKHVNRNFNTELATQLGLTGRQRINVIFKVDTEGHVTGIRSRAPHPKLEEEAIRVIKTLPQMTPGKQKGKAVVVPYSLPIIFEVQDQSVVDETVIEENGSTPSKNVLSEDIEVPFAVIEEVPIFPGCETFATNTEKRQCMSERIQDFVAKNFNTKLANNLGLVAGRQRINVIFKIDADGHITGVRSRASHPKLEEEAIRVINALPKMIPGKQKGKEVTVPYSLPIIFEVEDDTQMLDEVPVVGYADDTLEGTAIPFTAVDQVPVLDACKNLPQNEQRDCVSNEISKFVNKNFNTTLAKSLGLKGRQRLNVIFKIDKKGNIVDVKSKSQQGSSGLEAEANRVIKLLPKLKPGEHKGKKVEVVCSLPIIFQVQD